MPRTVLVLFAILVPLLLGALDLDTPAIRISVDKFGDFRIRTLAGDPGTKNDDDQPLIEPERFGASYILVSVDGQLGKFGWSMGKNTAETVNRNGVLVSQWEFGGVAFTQEVSLYRSLTATITNQARIKLWIRNAAGVAKKVGIRVVLDTTLGEDDMQGFYVPGRGYVERGLALLEEKDIPDYVYSMTHFARKTPNVELAFLGPGLVKPDHLYLARHRHLHPSKEFAVAVGRNFSDSLTGETALAFVWNPIVFAPGAENGVAFAFGLAVPAFISKDPLTASLQVPRELGSEGNWVSCLVENTDEFYDVRDLEVQLVASPGLAVTPAGNARRERLQSASRWFSSWRVEARGAVTGPRSLTVRITGNYRNAPYSAERVFPVSVRQ